MGKVFVHKPLRRAEIRRLSEPIKTAEAAPRPSMWSEEARIIAKLEAIREQFRLDRARKRSEQREAERRVEAATEAFVRHSQPLVIDGAAFIRWILETMETVQDEAEFASNCNLLTLTSKVECLVCGAPDPVQAGQCSIILFTGLAKDQPNLALAGVACPNCRGAKPRFYARSVVGMVTAKVEPEEATRRLRKLPLRKNDRALLLWVDEPRGGDDDKVIRRLVRSGVGAAILLRVEGLL